MREGYARSFPSLRPLDNNAEASPFEVLRHLLEAYLFERAAEEDEENSAPDRRQHQHMLVGAHPGGDLCLDII